MRLQNKPGFGPYFLQWMHVLMSDTKSCGYYCGWLSDVFNVESGVRDVCPFSPLAYVLAAETCMAVIFFFLMI